MTTRLIGKLRKALCSHLWNLYLGPLTKDELTVVQILARQGKSYNAWQCDRCGLVQIKPKDWMPPEFIPKE